MGKVYSESTQDDTLENIEEEIEIIIRDWVESQNFTSGSTCLGKFSDTKFRRLGSSWSKMFEPV